MDRKVRRKHHLDKPPHQRWLYKLADMHFFKFWMLLWAIIWVCIGAAFLLAKAVVSIFK